MDQLNLFVFGAGYSARAAIDALRREGGVEVSATTRTLQKAQDLTGSGIVPHLFEGTEPSETVSAALAHATHLLISIAPGPDGDPVLLHHGADIVAAPRLRWIGYYSTIGVYGDADGAWIDEGAATEPLSARNRYRLDAEARWRDLADGRNTPLAILRLAGIYGPGRSPFDKLRNGTARRINKPGQVFNRIHVADIGAITAAAARAELSGIFNLADDEPAPPQDVIAQAAELIGMAPPPEVAFEDADLSPMAKTFYAGNRRVSNAKIKSALGHGLLYPTYREGHAAILASEKG
jgi:nucleoside-diphosphate-sugar epimerase